jgi:hypothetical protein
MGRLPPNKSGTGPTRIGPIELRRSWAVYAQTSTSTSPSLIYVKPLAQTENFFVGHLSSQDETKALARVQVAFAGHEQDILRAKTPGFMRMMTLSNRFVVPIQAKKFEAVKAVK